MLRTQYQSLAAPNDMSARRVVGVRSKRLSTSVSVFCATKRDSAAVLLQISGLMDMREFVVPKLKHTRCIVVTDSGILRHERQLLLCDEVESAAWDIFVPDC